MNKKNRQIIAIGGGGFGRDPNHRKIEQYIIDQAHNDNPSMLFYQRQARKTKYILIIITNVSEFFLVSQLIYPFFLGLLD